MTRVYTQSGGTRDTRPALAFAGGVLLIAWVASFVAYLGADVTAHEPTHRLIAILGFAMPIVAAGVWLSARHPHATDPWIALALGAYAVVALSSTDTTASLETVGLVAAYAAAFGVGVRLPAGPVRSRIATAVAMAATVWAAVFAIRWGADAIGWLQAGGGWPPPTARTPLIWLSTDAVASLLILSAPFYAWVGRRAVRHVLAGTTLVCALVIIPLSGGRAAILGIAVGVVIWLGTSRRGLRVLRSSRARAAVLAIAALTAVAAIIVVLRVDPTLTGRTGIWSTALALAATDPITGSGPGTFSWARLEHAPDYVPRVAVDHAHNVVMQALVDGGLLLLSALTLLSAAVAGTVVRRLDGLDTGGRAALCALVAFATVLMLDELTQLPALAALAATQAGFVTGDALRVRGGAEGRSRRTRGWLPAAIGLAVLLSVPAVTSVQLARTDAAAARVAAGSGRWDDALAAYESAASRWQSNGLYQLGVGLANAELGNRKAATAAYLRATAVAPGDPRGWGGLAAMSPDTIDRIRYLDQASRLGSGDPQYDQRLALELWDQGREEDALPAFARAATINSQLLAAPPSAPWTTTRVATFMTQVAQAGARQHAAALPVARAVLGTPKDGDPLTMRSLAVGRAGDLESALELAAAAVEARESTDAYRLAVRLAELTCDAALEERYRALLRLLNSAHARFYASGIVPAANDHIYRELGAGDYQPLAAAIEVPLPREWPGPLLPDATCRAATR